MNLNKIRKTVVAHVQRNSHAYAAGVGAAIAAGAFVAYNTSKQMISGTEAMKMLERVPMIAATMNEGTLVAMTYETAKSLLAK